MDTTAPDTDETCIYCSHTVEHEQHFEGCTICACPYSIVPDQSGPFGQDD